MAPRKEAATVEVENFDSLYNGNRAFIIGGVTFHWEPLHWRDWGAAIDTRASEEQEKEQRIRAEVERLRAEGMSAEDAELQADENVDDTTLVETYEKVVDRCAIYVNRSEAENFKAVLNDPENRITVAQLNALMVWLQEVQTPDRPTTTPSASSSGAGSTGATSPAA
jgi:hypothetical protein